MVPTLGACFLGAVFFSGDFPADLAGAFLAGALGFLGDLMAVLGAEVVRDSETQSLTRDTVTDQRHGHRPETRSPTRDTVTD